MMLRLEPECSGHPAAARLAQFHFIPALAQQLDAGLRAAGQAVWRSSFGALMTMRVKE
jgi:hypothetical protein